jgi:magnesium transporter
MSSVSSQDQVATRAYRDGVLLQAEFDLAQVSDFLEQPDVVVWVDFLNPSREDLLALADELGLHPLAVEDALEEHQRPKVDFYDTHQFLSCHALQLDADNATIREAEIDCFLSKQWLITVRKDPLLSLDDLFRRWDRSSDLLRLGPAFMLYGLLDLVVDQYFDALAQFDQYYEDVSDELFSDHPIGVAHQRHWFEMRRSLVRFHRLVIPLREAVSGLMRREHTAVDENLYPYLQDLYDHILRVSESSEALRDLVATIVETNLSLRDYRQNQIVKQVTSWAAIVAVPTLITGFFGMNVPFPGSGTTAGAIWASVLVLSGSFALYLEFRRRDWL